MPKAIWVSVSHIVATKRPRNLGCFGPVQWAMKSPIRSLAFCIVLSTTFGLAQPGLPILTSDEHYTMGETGEDPSPDLNAYEAMNKALGGDSVRSCGGHACLGWVEDKYPDGTTKHRGYYDEGKLTQYRNYHPDGTLERDFKAIDAVKSVERIYHSNGNLRSEAKFAEGVCIQYEDHYLDGKLRYAEERHRKEPYFLRMDLFDAEGRPVSLLELVDKKRIEFEQKEYHPGGLLKAQGRARYDPKRMDTQRVGTWTYYGKDGEVAKSEEYLDGRVAVVR